MIALRQRSRAELDRCMSFSPNTRWGPVVRMRRAKNLPKILTVEKACCDVFQSGSRRDRSPINRVSSRSSPGSPWQRRLVIAAIDPLLLDQPAAVKLHAEIVIEAHGVERPGVGRGKPLHHLPIGAHCNPLRGALERYVLHPVLAAAPPWLSEGLARPAPHGNTLSGRWLHDAIWGECCDHALDTAPVVGPHVAPQHILDAEAIVHAYLGCHCQVSPSPSELQRPYYWAARLRASSQLHEQNESASHAMCGRLPVGKSLFTPPWQSRSSLSQQREILCWLALALPADRSVDD